MSERYELPEDILKTLEDEEEQLEHGQEATPDESVQEEIQETELPEVPTQEAPAPAQEEEFKRPEWAEDFSRLESRMEVYLRQVAEKLEQFGGRPNNAPYQEDYQTQYEQDPAMVKIQEIERRQMEYERSVAIGNARSEMNNSVARMAAQYPDFHTLIPPQAVEQAFVQSVQNNVRIPWQAHLEQNYWLRKGPALAQELQAQKEAAQKQSDEIARQRQIKEQKQQEIHNASSVPSGGGNFQARERTLNPGHHGYADAIANAKASMQEKLGG